MKCKREEMGVSDIVGTILLLGMTISFFTLLSVAVLSYPTPSHPPSANLVGTIEGDYLLIEHRGGEPLSLDTKIVLNGNGFSKSITIGDSNYLDTESKEDNLWGIGEWLIYHDNTTILNGKLVSISVVDVGSNSVIMTGSLQGT